MSIIGRRGSSDSAWIWSPAPSAPEPPEPAEPTPPLPPQPPPPEDGEPPPAPGPPFLPLAGLAIVLALIAVAALGVWLSEAEGDGGVPPGVTPTIGTPFTASPVPTPTPAATPEPTPTPEATPTPAAGDFRFVLTVWDGESWRFSPPAQASFPEGEAVPFMLRVGGAETGDEIVLTIEYDRTEFEALSPYDTDSGDGPALASGGPGNAYPDTALAIPGSAGGGTLSLWGGTLATARGGYVTFATNVMLNVTVTPLSDSLFLLWSGVVAPDASARVGSLNMLVIDEGGHRFQIEIDPDSVTPP